MNVFNGQVSPRLALAWSPPGPGRFFRPGATTPVTPVGYGRHAADIMPPTNCRCRAAVVCLCGPGGTGPGVFLSSQDSPAGVVADGGKAERLKSGSRDRDGAVRVVPMKREALKPEHVGDMLYRPGGGRRTGATRNRSGSEITHGEVEEMVRELA